MEKKVITGLTEKNMITARIVLLMLAIYKPKLKNECLIINEELKKICQKNAIYY